MNIARESIKKLNQFHIKYGVMPNTLFLGKIAENILKKELEDFSITVSNKESQSLDGKNFNGMDIKILDKFDKSVIVGRII
jgi:hypothetical protein